MVNEPKGKKPPAVGGAYAHYVLLVLVVVSIFNFVDRNILAILSQDIQADLGISDADMGFLYGTVFALFYAIFGIPLARFADVWVRRSIIAGGLFFWSLMTALSGLARSFSVLATFRVGVGIGEASATPAAYSMLADYYSPKLRATVIAIYSGGVYIGGGIGLFLGGAILEAWQSAYPNVSDAPFNLKGWQVAFFIVGLPGLLLAILVRSLKEPSRGISEGLMIENYPYPFSILKTELVAMIPFVNLVALKRDGASISANCLAALLIFLVSWILIVLTDNVPQWLALGVGVYLAFCWVQSLKARDSVTFDMIFRSKAVQYTVFAFPTLAFVTYGIGFWTPALMLRLHDTSPAEVGMYLGLGGAAGGLLGVTIGGRLADWAKTKHPSGRLAVGYLSIFGTVPLVLWMIFTDDLNTAFLLWFLSHLFSASWPSVAPATITDLVLPRMRAAVSAYYILVVTMIGLALGPYCMGQLSDMYASTGASPGEALQTAIATSLLIFLITIVLIFLASRYLPEEERTRLDRARLLGEKI